MTKKRARCCALYASGLRCKSREGVRLVMFHGDGEIYTYPCEIQSAAVPMCAKHREETGSSVYVEAAVRDYHKRQAALQKAGASPKFGNYIVNSLDSIDSTK